MNNEVTTSTISKLGSEILEIRLRALKSVELAFKVYDQLIYNGPYLMKSLIEWFHLKPRREETCVLNLIHEILKGDQRDDTIYTFGLKKLQEKLSTIDQGLETGPQKDVMRKILLSLSSHEHVKDLTDTLTNTSLDEKSNFSMSSVQVDDLNIDSANALEYLDYVVPWDIPDPSDLNSLNLLKSSLRLDADMKDIMHAVSFLKTAIVDFPAEYFLQPPYIFQCLKSLLKEKQNELSVELLDVFGHMTKALDKRVKIRTLTRTFCWEESRQMKHAKKTQISVGRYFAEVFQITLNFFKDIIHCTEARPRLQQEFRSCFTVFFALIDLARHTNGRFQFRNILRDFGYLTKYFRKTWDKSPMDQSNRNLYVNTLYLMSKIVLLKNEMNSDSALDTERDMESVLSSPSDANIWKQELENALFDFLLKQSYCEVYDTTLKAVQTYNDVDTMVQHLHNCNQILKPAVKLLQDPMVQNNDEFITCSLVAIQSLSLHKSIDLVQRIFAVVQELVPLFEGHPVLKGKCETILLKLIAHENKKVKKTIYKLCCKNVKSYFSSLMEGSTILTKTFARDFTKTRYLGIPLTSEILIELICFGLSHADEQIQNNAETILSLILKCRSILGTRWLNIFEILAPTFPLLLCYASKKTTLGQAILSMITPDSDLPTQFLVQCNVVLLFNNDYAIRQDAVAALMYLLLDQDDSDDYLPSIQSITDVIPNNICILDDFIHPIQIRSKFVSGIHERHSLDSLLELLRASNMEPAERKTAFLQLNILTQEPQLIEVFQNANGFFLCLDALKNSLKENQSTDSLDNALPLIGTIVKILLQSPEYRHDFVHDTNIYFLFLRTLLIFHQHSGLKADCAIGLFLLAFGEYSLGSYTISVPNVCSALKLPFFCELYWKESKYNQKSDIEQLLLNADNDRDDPNSDRSETAVDSKILWQYVRLQFADLWFGGIGNISIDFTCSDNKDLAVVYSSEDNYPNAMQFDKKLCLTKADLLLIQASNISYVFKHWFHAISNATRHGDVTTALSAISNNLFAPGICTDELNEMNISNTFIRFYASTPNNDQDEVIFIELIGLFENFIKNEYNDFLHWLLNEFKKASCTFINMLQSSHCSRKCYTSNCRFIGIALEYAIYSEDENIQKTLMSDLPKARDESERTNLLNKMFSNILPLLDSSFESGDFDKFRSLLSLLQIVTSSRAINIDEEFMSYVANKLLRFISSLKSLAQSGSNLNKNCLLVISNLMYSSDDEAFIEPKYIKFLSGLCGHKDVEIRTFSWTILNLAVKKERGAQTLIECLSYLPGGFHACCLSTLLDVSESSTVREIAGLLFMKLIQFVDANRDLLKSVTPRCNDRPLSDDDNAFDIIVDIIKYQRFFVRISESLEHFFVGERITENIDNTIITTCDVVRVYCDVLTGLIYLNQAFVGVIYDDGLLFDIIRLIPHVRLCTNESSILMLIDICTLMALCFVTDAEIAHQFGLQENAAFATLIHCLQSKIYDDLDDNLKMTAFNKIILIITFAANTYIGYNLIWNFSTQNEMESLFQAIIFGLQTENDLTVAVLKLLSSLLTSNGKSETNYFGILFDKIQAKSSQSQHQIKENGEVIGYKTFIERRCIEINNASELILSFLMELFKSPQKNSKIRFNVRKTIALLLAGSPEARKLAASVDFVDDVLDEIESILTKVGTYGDFVRKYGEQKKDPIITQLKASYNILFHWFSEERLSDETVVNRICQIISDTWSWTGSNSSFQFLVMKTLAFLTEDSVLVCKAIATRNIRTSRTVLQLLVENASSETMKPKKPISNLELLGVTLRTLSNCCCSVEGRIQLTKLNVFNAMDRLHPTLTKQHRPWNSVLLLWLEFYEVYTRYPDVTATKHLQLLCFIIKKVALPRMTTVSLTIIRNMAFGTAVPALLASDVLQQTLSNSLEDENKDIQLIAATCIWKLIANNYRGKHKIRSSSIPLKVILAFNKLASTDENTELFYVLETVNKILSN